MKKWNPLVNLSFFWKKVHIPEYKFQDVTNYPLKRNLTPRFRESRIRDWAWKIRFGRIKKKRLKG
jgi:hypothetical protein